MENQVLSDYPFTSSDLPSKKAPVSRQKTVPIAVKKMSGKGLGGGFLKETSTNRKFGVLSDCPPHHYPTSVCLPLYSSFARKSRFVPHWDNLPMPIRNC